MPAGLAYGSPRDGRDANRLIGRAPHPRLGTASLHASLIQGGRELSSHPDVCHLQMERRPVPGERPGCAAGEVAEILARLSAADASFKAASRPMLARPPRLPRITRWWPRSGPRSSPVARPY